MEKEIENVIQFSVAMWKTLGFHDIKFYLSTRPVGAIGLAIATAIALSTLFIKQHYVLDIVAGLALAAATYAWFIVRGFRPGR